MRREREREKKKKNRDRKWARERIREGQSIMKAEVYRIRKTGLGNEKGRDRGTELARGKNGGGGNREGSTILI